MNVRLQHPTATATIIPAMILVGVLLSASVVRALPIEQNEIPDYGANEIVDPLQFGSMENRAAPDYRYEITDREALAGAEGPGIYPNESSFERDPLYKRLQKAGFLEGSLDKFHPDANPTLAFYKWSTQKAGAGPALRLLNVGQALERGGQGKRAFNAYYAAAVNFPKEINWLDGHPWYVSITALDEAKRLMREHSEWKLALVDAAIDVENGFDRKATNDVYHINPGRIVALDSVEGPSRPSNDDIVENRGEGAVHLARRRGQGWQLLVDGRPYIIRGVCYSPTPVGRSPDFDGYKPHTDWMESDLNKNSRIDGPYDSWVDVNFNNTQDEDEATVGDFALLRDMGANTIRLYHHQANQPLLRDLTANYGIRVLLGDLIGAYTVGSGAAWEVGTDYSQFSQREAMRESVRTMVLENRNEPYVLMWVLGNENNYGHGNNAPKNPATYYRFVNSLARMIHSLDPNHPVALCNGDLENMDLMVQECPEVDVLAINAYRGPHGMGDSFWDALARVWKKPMFISEFGAPAYNELQELEEAEETQADYLAGNWHDIERNFAGAPGNGLCLGGVVFEWVDEWWKAGSHYEPSVHDRTAQSNGPFYGGKMYEEWLGIMSQGNGEKSPFLRRVRPAYERFKTDLWANADKTPAAIWSDQRSAR